MFFLSLNSGVNKKNLQALQFSIWKVQNLSETIRDG